MLSCGGFFLSCEKDPVPLTTNSVITGTVHINSSGIDYDSTIVVASGPYGQSSALTDIDGHFVIPGLGNGTYLLDYSREGFGTIRQYNIQLFGNDTAYAVIVELFKIPEVKYLPVLGKAYNDIRPRYYPQKTFVCIDTDLSPTAESFSLQFVLCLGTDEDVSWNNCRIYDFSWEMAVNSDHMTIYLDPDRLRNTYLFRTGEKVYVVGYLCNKQEMYGYLDTYLGIRQYSTLDKTRFTNVISFIMP
jgi:hypothetical protein